MHKSISVLYSKTCLKLTSFGPNKDITDPVIRPWYRESAISYNAWIQ